MSISLPDNVKDLSDLRGQVGIFRNREHAGEILAGMLEVYSDNESIVMAVPAGGVPVAKVLAEQLNLPIGHCGSKQNHPAVEYGGWLRSRGLRWNRATQQRSCGAA